MKIYLTAVIKAKEEYRAEVLEVLQNMVRETRKEEANELYALHQEIEDQNQFVSMKSGKVRQAWNSTISSRTSGLSVI